MDCREHPAHRSRGVQYRHRHPQYADIIQRHIALGDVNRSYDVPMAVSNVPLRPEPEVVESVNQLTIEQLAAAPGMSVRNIRSHQARGLLAPPEVRLRVGYYGPEHVAQLRLIRDLQEEGFNLNGIKRLLDDMHGTAERLRPIASESLLSIFQQRLGTQIEEAFGEITRRLSQRRRKA